MPTDIEMKDLADLWIAAAEPIRDQQTKALLLDVNFRLDLAKALNAAIKTAKACAKGKAFLATGGIDVFAGLEAAYSAIAAAACAVSSVAESVNPLVYVGCLILAEHENGLDSSAFEAELREFLKLAEKNHFPWWTGLSEARIAQARQILDEQQFAALIIALRKSGFLVEVDGKLKYQQKNFTLGFLDR